MAGTLVDVGCVLFLPYGSSTGDYGVNCGLDDDVTGVVKHGCQRQVINRNALSLEQFTGWFADFD